MSDKTNKPTIGDVFPEHLLDGWVSVKDFVSDSEKPDPTGSEQNDDAGSGILMSIIRDVAILLVGGLVFLVIFGG